MTYLVNASTKKCPPKKYCIFRSINFNEHPGADRESHRAWSYGKAWKDFRFDPATGISYSPNPTDVVESVINNGVGRTIYFMEWNFVPAAPSTKVCLGVRSGHAVRNVRAYTGGDAGYGSVSFSKPEECTVKYSAGKD